MEWKRKAFDLLSRLVAVPSVNPGERPTYSQPYGELEVGEELIQYFKETMPYMKVKKTEVLPDRYNIFATYFRGDEFPTIMLVTHLDTVDIQGMTIPPFTLVENNGKWYGRGSCDDKGQITAMLIGLQKAFYEENNLLPLNINFVAVVDEEHKHLGVDALVENSDLQVDLAIVGEPTELKIAAFHKGSVRFKVTTYGKSVHSSTPWVGVNAIDNMADVIQVLKGSVKEQVESITDPLCGKSSISQTIIYGGEQVNIIPKECTIHIDRRLNPQENWKIALDHIKEIVNNDIPADISKDIKWSEPYLIDPPLFNDLEHISLITLKQLMRKEDKNFDYVGLPFGCDASKIAPHQIPTVVYGPGSIDQAHTKDEWIEFTDLMCAVDTYKNIFRDFSRELGDSNEKFKY